MSTATLLAAVLIAVGLAGVIVPVLPGPLLVLGGITYWAFDRSDPTGWFVLGLCALVLAVGLVAKYAFPGRRMREAGVPWTSLTVGAGLGIVGFFVIPVLGLPIGFVLGVYLAELARVGSSAAWPSTRHAVTAVGLSLLIEFSTSLLAALIWALAAFLTR
jgi:uncharacterized protein YqgC (DUF456 family)